MNRKITTTIVSGDMRTSKNDLFLRLQIFWRYSSLIAAIIFAFSLAAPAASSEEYRFDSGDVLDVRVLEKKEVAGSYTVRADGSFSLPGIGIIQARGETAESLENKLRGLVDQTIVDPSVSVNIKEYRPFFILGEVAEAGSYPFLPNLTVLQAISIAKGFRHDNESGDRFAKKLANLRATQLVEDNAVALHAAQVQLERTIAERDDLSSFTYSQTNAPHVSAEKFRQIVETEQALFTKRKEFFSKRLNQEKQTLSARELEAESYQKRIDTQGDLINQIKAEREEIADLRKKGLVSNQRLNTLIREEIRVNGSVLQTKSLQRQAEVAINETNQSILALTVGRELEIRQSIRDLKERISRLEATLKGELSIKNDTNRGKLNSADPDSEDFRFELYRGEKLVQSQIRFDTRLQPGDTLVILSNSK